MALLTIKAKRQTVPFGSAPPPTPLKNKRKRFECILLQTMRRHCRALPPLSPSPKAVKQNQRNLTLISEWTGRDRMLLQV
jgi:hypothetical protein